MDSLSLPIYRKKFKAQQTETNVLKTATEQNRQSMLNYLKTEYFEAMQSYDDAQRRIKLYESQRQLARQSLDILIKTFSSAAIGLTDILLIRQQLLDYGRKQVEAVADFNQAKAWIKRLIPNP
jgi:outer membrane protein TolC